MNGKTRAYRLTTALGVTLAAIFLAAPTAHARPHASPPAHDGWYYTALSHTKATCNTNRTFEQASQAGVLSDVYAALHGTDISNSFVLSCS